MTHLENINMLYNRMHELDEESQSRALWTIENLRRQMLEEDEKPARRGGRTNGTGRDTRARDAT